MSRAKVKRESRLSVRVAPAIESRLDKVAHVSGQTQAVVASMALSIGLRTLEHEVLGDFPLEALIDERHLLREVRDGAKLLDVESVEKGLNRRDELNNDSGL